MKNTNLGMLTTTLFAAYRMPNPRTAYLRGLAAAHAAGFPTLARALDAIEERTSPKWLYNSGLNLLIIDGVANESEWN